MGKPELLSEMDNDNGTDNTKKEESFILMLKNTLGTSNINFEPK